MRSLPSMEGTLMEHHRFEMVGRLAAGFCAEVLTWCGPDGDGAAAGRSNPTPSAGTPPTHGATELPRLAHLARRLAHFGTPDRRPIATFNLVALVEESLPLLRLALPPTVALRPHFPLHRAALRANPHTVMQLLCQLVVDSAAAFLAETGEIHISVTRLAPGALPDLDSPVGAARSYLCLQVSDTAAVLPPGIGSPAAPFSPALGGRPAHPVRPLVHHLVHQLQGALVQTATPGQGTVVQAYLPEAAPPSPPPVGASPATAHVLIIDDEESVASLARQALEFSGYQTSSLADPHECLTRLAREPERYSLILTDQRMPQMSGVELVRALRAAGHRTPVLLMSGSIEAVTQGELEAAQPARFLSKPFTLPELLGAVQEMVATTGRP